jgi:hypothetical protein
MLRNVGALLALAIAMVSCGLVEPEPPVGSLPGLDGGGSRAPVDAPRAHDVTVPVRDAGRGPLDAGRDAGVDAWVAPESDARSPDAADGHGDVQGDSPPAVEAGHDAATDARDAVADAPPAVDAGHDAALDAGHDAGHDAATDAQDAARACFRACPLGDTQCTAYVCANPACTKLTAELTTCAVSDSGCPVWSSPTACSPALGCCTPFGSVGPLGTPCLQDEDCDTNACDGVSHICTHAQCSDHRQDGDETDVDCGGSDCSACATGKGCKVNFDCQSGICMPAHTCR